MSKKTQEAEATYIIKGEIDKQAKTEGYHKYLWYLIIFSLIGLGVECIVNLIRAKVGNNQFGTTTGPLCTIYGISAIIMIKLLSKYKRKNIKLFIYGVALGTAIEYVMSFIIEAILGVRLWDQSAIKFNINGRACLIYSILWGFLTIVLINILQAFADKIIDLIKGRARRVWDIVVTVVIALYTILVIWGFATYSIRARETLNGKNYISNNNIIEKFQNTVFSNEIMEKLFPNLKINDKQGNKILVRQINNR